MGKIKLKIKGSKPSVIQPISQHIPVSSSVVELQSALIREVIKEVPIEVIRTVEVERIVEIPIEVIKTIEIEKIIEVIKEVPIIKREIIEIEKVINRDVPKFIDRIVVKYKTPDYITGILVIQSIINILLIMAVAMK